MKYITAFMIVIITQATFSQVGVNTTEPYAMLTVNGSTGFTVLQLANFNIDNVIGVAPNTVDKYTSFSITQTTANVVLSLPEPTNTNQGRIVTVTNAGATSFTLDGVVVPPESGLFYQWAGSKWFPFNAGSGAGTVDNTPCDIYEEQITVPGFDSNAVVSLEGWSQTGPIPHEIIIYPTENTIGSNNTPISNRYPFPDRYAMVRQDNPLLASDEPQLNVVNAAHTHSQTPWIASRYAIGFTTDVNKGPVNLGDAGANPINLFIRGTKASLYTEGQQITDYVILDIEVGDVLSLKLLANGSVEVYKNNVLTTLVAGAVTTSLNLPLYPYVTHMYSTSRTHAMGLSDPYSYTIEYVKQMDGSYAGDNGSTYPSEAELIANRPNVSCK